MKNISNHEIYRFAPRLDPFFFFDERRATARPCTKEKKKNKDPDGRGRDAKTVVRGIFFVVCERGNGGRETGEKIELIRSIKRF